MHDRVHSIMDIVPSDLNTSISRVKVPLGAPVTVQCAPYLDRVYLLSAVSLRADR